MENAQDLVRFTNRERSFMHDSFQETDKNIRTRGRKNRMKRTTTVIALLGICLFFSATVTAQQRSDAADSLIVRARTMVDSGYAAWNKDEMLHGYALLQRAAVVDPGGKYVEYYLAYAGYRLMTYGMAMKQEDVYKEFADETDKRAERLGEKYAAWSEPKALLAAIYGIEIAHSWMSGVTLGPKSNSLAEKAISLDSTNPRAYLILGTGKLNTPAIFGGSVGKAIEYFKKSVSLFETGPTEPKSGLEPTWGYLDALTWLGLAYEKEDRYADALAEYRKALAADPAYARARYVLVPGVEKKMNHEK